MQVTETPLLFECLGKKLVGVIHESDSNSKIGVLIIVGGPQYRVGSHRQFVLLARYLASQGVSTMRFDVRGMGDSEGEQRRYDKLDDDIRAGINSFVANCTNIKEVVLWGLCDAASAALFYAYQDDRVRGVVLLNPWVFSERGAAKTYVKHYYLRRVLSKNFWAKLLSFKFDIKASVSSFFKILVVALGRDADKDNASSRGVENLSLPVKMRECLRMFNYPVLLILSGRDLTADEFKDVVASDSGWQYLLNEERVTRVNLEEADHTFSSGKWRSLVEVNTLNWINNLR
ncbi:hydrolase 1, exosortase A system-associated [Methylomonas methanica]|uniref:Hydrolase, exosortase system type 1 associated n=1 Tax=Methylomonas methanica (strain DSM 25384 / MC09) TaxID=857087 RepID=F9ZWH4_METMM|nr:hydrolase 1, exosortase A system-associated [Methylomonas methanica]AEF99643.1 hydrolase, exosortase system type 1 associated [Methylomonas methanica MC09]